MANPQRVIIPKGYANPNEMTIVEIPEQLKNAPVVVAKPKIAVTSASYSSSRSPSPDQKIVRKRQYRRRSYPPARQPGYGMLHDAGITYGGMPGDESSLDPSYIQYQLPNDPKSFGDLSRGPVPEYDPGVFHKPGVFNPDRASTPQDISYVEGSLYRDFRPTKGMSTFSPNKGDSMYLRPPSVKHYHSSVGTVSPDSPAYQQSGSWEYASGSPEGSYYESSPKSLTRDQLTESLGELESSELHEIMDDLNSFQSARRKLIFDASSLASAADVSSRLLGTNSI